MPTEQSDMIFHHENWQPISIGRYIGAMWAQIKNSDSSMPDIPDADSPASSVNAYINQGRWIAECPSGCGHALIAGQPPGDGDNTLYICLSPPLICPAAKTWYIVRYPREKQAIEAVLIKRPAKRPFYAEQRNWTGETLPALRAENIARGVPV